MLQVHKVALEMVCTVALERRLGFIDQNINLDIQTIMTSLEGYKVGVNGITFMDGFFGNNILDS
jgi:hypothetical protein